jgi:hypothetical protein
VKLRVRHNSIRFRLGQSEVHALRNFGECREAIHFPCGSQLEYIVRSDAKHVDAAFRDGVVAVAIPRPELATWQSSDQVSITAEIQTPSGITLQVLVEKDFRCLDERITEDQSDTFVNPLSAHMSC